jgi:hypothetical protein
MNRPTRKPTNPAPEAPAPRPETPLNQSRAEDGELELRCR